MTIAFPSSKVLKNMSTPDNYDFVIIGGGSAGCVLANRLSADASQKVLLLEAGERDRHLWLKVPLKFRDLMTDMRFNWGYETEPEPHLDNRKLYIPRGKVLGGSSSINGMLYCRCHPSDYDHWRQLGLAGWGYADVLPYFKRSERFPDGESTYHGGDGPLVITKGDRTSHAHKAYLQAGRANGYPVTADHNGEMQDGFGPADYTIGGGRRSSASRVFLKPVMSRPNLTVITGALANRIMFEGTRATGVEYRCNGAVFTARAGREVLLSGGAYNSPQILMLSGIGPAAHLKEHGVKPVYDARDVGRNLQDHVHVGVGYQSEHSFDAELRADRLAVAALNWLLFRQGHLATLPVACLAYIRTRPELSAPDIELLMNRVNPEAHIWFPGIRKPKGGYIGTRVVLLHPESRGSVTLRSGNAADKAVIHHNYLSAQHDMDSLREGVKRALEIYATEPLASMTGAEVFPGKDIRTDSQIDAYIRSTASMIYHPTSTCRMGSDPHAVVDAELRVNGVSGLRVVDASVMPAVPGGHTNAATIMIAEKAADLILGRKALPAAELPVSIAAE